MKRLVLLFGLFIFFTSCQQPADCEKSGATSLDKNKQEAVASNCPAPTPDPTPVPNPDPVPGPTPDPVPGPTPDPVPQPGSDVPNEALIFEVKTSFTNFEAEDEAKVYKAIEIIKKVVASQEFKDRVIGFTYSGQKQFVDNKGLTNSQIYSILLAGKEDLIPEVDHEMDLDLELYYSWRSTVGYTYPDTTKIWMNRKFFDVYTPAEVAGNMFHEWTHKLGFDHDFSYSTSRDSSVPYALGYLMEELGKKYE